MLISRSQRTKLPDALEFQLPLDSAILPPTPAPDKWVTGTMASSDVIVKVLPGFMT